MTSVPLVCIFWVPVFWPQEFPSHHNHSPPVHLAIVGCVRDSGQSLYWRRRGIGTYLKFHALFFCFRPPEPLIPIRRTNPCKIFGTGLILSAAPSIFLSSLGGGDLGAVRGGGDLGVAISTNLFLFPSSTQTLVGLFSLPMSATCSLVGPTG